MREPSGDQHGEPSVAWGVLVRRVRRLVAMSCTYRSGDTPSLERISAMDRPLGEMAPPELRPGKNEACWRVPVARSMVNTSGQRLR